MSVYFSNGRGQVYEGIFIEYNGYMPTIGPANGTGKMYQPGTRGTIVDDSTKNVSTRPAFVFKGSDAGSECNFIRLPNYMGYATAYCDSNDNIKIQGNTTYINDAWYGMTNIIRNFIDPSGSGSNLRYVILPCPITEYTYALDASRWGDKPINGNYSLWNVAGLRGLVTPSGTTIHKWEIHVIISVIWSNINQSWWSIGDRIKYVWIPRYTNNTWYTHTLSREKFYMWPGAAGRGVDYLYYVIESSIDIPGGTQFFYPAIAFDGSHNLNVQPTYYIQTKFCFKAD